MGDSTAEHSFAFSRDPFDTILACCGPIESSGGSHVETRLQRDRRGQVLRSHRKFFTTDSPTSKQRRGLSSGYIKEDLLRGFRPDYSIGEAIRSPSHMITAPASVEALNKNDFAFVRRSNGSFSYAVVAHRHQEPRIVLGKKQPMEEFIIFFLNCGGYTKMVEKRHWHEFVRCVSMHGVDRSTVRAATNIPAVDPSYQPSLLMRHLVEPSVFLCQEPSHPAGVPPGTISFAPQLMDEECSLISNLSTNQT